jgi:AcrR family transcriptional regulator
VIEPDTRLRGRPRSESCRAAILTAAGELMLEGGLAAATMEAIAARAGVSKATIYKWWPSRGAVALDGLLARVSDSLIVPEGVPARVALQVQIAALISLFTDSTTGQLLRALVATAQTDPEIARALRERWISPRRAVAAEIVRTGIARGEIRPDTDVAAAVDQLFAPVYHRLLFGHDQLDTSLAAIVVGNLIDGVGVSASVDSI